MVRRPLAFITGATSGIGFALAKKFAQNGFDLALTGRDVTRLQSVQTEWEQKYDVAIKYCAHDLSVSSTPEELCDVLHAEMMEVDVLVNNAGFGLRGEFAELPLADQLALLQVNVVALTHLTHLLLPEMLRRGSGKILNVASVAAFEPGPLMAVYYASKAYVLNFSLALREELKDKGITVTTLCPGPTATQFSERAGAHNTHLFQRLAMMDADTVADAAFKGLMNGKALVVPGVMNKFFTQAVRCAPRTLLPRIVKKLHGNITEPVTVRRKENF